MGSDTPPARDAGLFRLAGLRVPSRTRKFATLLMSHATERLNVRHIGDHVVAIDAAEDNDILALRTRGSGMVAGDLPFHQLTCQLHHRERSWERNCLAIGLFAGFLEPLEVSAIVLIESSPDVLLNDFPAIRRVMDAHAMRFNTLFRNRRDRIVDFRKLHYVLSVRDEPYCRAHRDLGSPPPWLTELLRVWRDQPPSLVDFSMIGEMLPASSYKYILYGTGFPPPPGGANVLRMRERVNKLLADMDQRRCTLIAKLPINRAYLEALQQANVRPGIE